ncbi:hypothetical protein Fmac_007950 [Flemingia macrophylla]|uniref:Uncharacterized protein n=1 Tax=Flemingia macrophylla TaxID=520843 RepID=A0ABD1MYD1_9FABA
MGKDCGTWVPHLQFGWQSPNFNPFDVGKQDGISPIMNPGGSMISSNETIPAFASAAQHHLQLGHSNEPGGWFYCLPHIRQGFTPAPNFTAEPKGKPLVDHVKGFGDRIAPYGESSSPCKQFLVIDQTGGQTTIVYSSRFGSPSECAWHSKLHGADYLRGNEPFLRSNLNLNMNLSHMTEPTLADKVTENPGTSIDSEMHEDTEEINALLYSDSDDYSTRYDDDDDDDDDVTSTGHSPSTMTTHDNHHTVGGSSGVASSSGKTKKRKLLDGYYDDIQLIDTASSQNLNKSSAVGDDAESRCSGNNCEGSLSDNKRMKKEKIRGVLSILQSIIPGRKVKDPAILLDDAKRCLKSLKHKAQVLGLDAL